MTKKKDYMNEIRKLSADELKSREKSLAEQIMKDRIAKASDPSKDSVSKRQARRELAQVLTAKSMLKGLNA